MQQMVTFLFAFFSVGQMTVLFSYANILFSEKNGRWKMFECNPYKNFNSDFATLF